MYDSTFFREWIVQGVKEGRRRLESWRGRLPYLLGIGGIGGIALLLYALYPVQMIRWYGVAQGWTTERLGLSPAGSPLPNLADNPGNQKSSPAALSEREDQLEKELGEQKKIINEQAEVVGKLQEQLKGAVAEVARSDDLLTKQQEEWLATLRRVGLVQQVSVESPSPSDSPDISESGKINVNTATAAELDGLPGIGPTYAQRIIAYRDQKGPFKSIEDITKVQGIGPHLLDQIKDKVEV